MNVHKWTFFFQDQQKPSTICQRRQWSFLEKGLQPPQNPLLWLQKEESYYDKMHTETLDFTSQTQQAAWDHSPL